MSISAPVRARAGRQAVRLQQLQAELEFFCDACHDGFLVEKAELRKSVKHIKRELDRSLAYVLRHGDLTVLLGDGE